MNNNSENSNNIFTRSKGGYKSINSPAISLSKDRTKKEKKTRKKDPDMIKLEHPCKCNCNLEFTNSIRILKKLYKSYYKLLWSYRREISKKLDKYNIEVTTEKEPRAEENPRNQTITISNSTKQIKDRLSSSDSKSSKSSVLGSLNE